ncbi:hypothetical protein COLO4_06637 [Corchorus olitorius]|uniref:Protein LNK3 n=1 Tax=Corchorus olitorius TaxID=93759 RepID=A0A1R3KME4_9ROSI|nr:hypothetical protein COLO4_06637 [Corchorus olitorius]
MDWYYCNGIEDLVVPKDQELADRLPSPDSWSKWGFAAPESFESSNKCFIEDASLSHEELKLNGKSCNGADFEKLADAKGPSSNSSVCGGLSEVSLNQASISHSQPDYPLDDFSRFQQLDDIFLYKPAVINDHNKENLMPLLGDLETSLMQDQDLPETEDLHKSCCSSSEDQCVRTLASYHLTDVSSDSQSIPNNEHGMGSAKYLKTHAFSPSMNLEEEIPALSNSPTVKAPPEQKSPNGFVSAGISLEESVLQELETVMAQLSDKTRICFRDAFYRLAKNTKQNHIAPNQQENLYVQTHPPMWTISEEKTRSGRKEITESETNTVDRAIANLTFNKMETNVQDFPVTTRVNSKQHVKGMGQLDHRSRQSQGQELIPGTTCRSDCSVRVGRIAEIGDMSRVMGREVEMGRSKK